MLVPCHIPHASTPPPFHAIPCLGMDALFLRERLHGADAGGCKGASGQDDHSRAYGLALCRLGRCIGGSLRLVSDVSGKQMVNQLWLIHGDLSFSLPFFFLFAFFLPFTCIVHEVSKLVSAISVNQALVNRLTQLPLTCVLMNETFVMQGQGV